MFRLADEIVAIGGRVVTTATTRLWIVQTRHAPLHVQSLPDLRSALDGGATHVLITGEFDRAEDKALGISPSLFPLLQSLVTRHPSPVTILVEADGARQLPFKAPAEHEPAIPECATLVVPVAGIDAIGKPLTAEFVHRPEFIGRLHPGRTVTPEMVAAVLGHPLGGRKAVPAGAQVVVLINKVETDEQRLTAKTIADQLLGMEGIDGVTIGAVIRNDPIDHVVYRDRGR